MNQKFNRPILILIILASIAVIVRGNRYPRPRSVFEPRINSSYQAAQRPDQDLSTSWRGRFLNSAHEVDPSGLTSSIFLGDDHTLSTEVITAFRTAGLSHVLAASGYNCWIVAQIFVLLGRGIAALLTRRRSFEGTYRVRRTIESIAPLAGAGLFFFWSDKSPPIQRSVLFVTTQFALGCIGIRGRFLSTLLAQYCLMLILKPIFFWSASFQLTFSCLFGLTLIPEIPWIRPLTRSAVGRYFVSTFSACLGCVPWTFLFFDEINFNSIQTNWFTAPVVSFWIMPFGLAAMLAMAPGVYVLGGSILAKSLLVVSAKGTSVLVVLLKSWEHYGIDLRF